MLLKILLFIYSIPLTGSFLIVRQVLQRAFLNPTACIDACSAYLASHHFILIIKSFMNTVSVFSKK